MVHVPVQKRRKWDKKATKMIFVGYDDDTKGFRCIDPKTKKLTVSRDVKFLTKPEKVTLNIDNDVNKHFPENVNVEPDTNSVNEPETNSANESDPDDTVIVINDSIYEDTFEDNDNDETVDDPNDHTYEPSNDTILDAEDEQKNDVSPKKNKANKKKQSEPINNLNLLNFAFSAEPKIYSEAKKDPDAEHWKLAMDEEIESHKVNGTWTLQNLPPGRKAIPSKWVYKHKRNQDGEIIRYKARLVAKGCSQVYDKYYNETFSPVVRYTSVRHLLALAVKNGLRCHQMDAITAYLHGEIHEEIYMLQPEGYEDGTERVCRLHKAIYGSKQAGRLWNLKLNGALKEFGLERSKLDPCLYFNHAMDMIIAIYVDDFIMFYKDVRKLDKLRSFLNKNFRMKDIGPIQCCLGMRVTQTEKYIDLDQERYTKDILERFGMSNCKAIGTPRDINQKLSEIEVTENDNLFGKIAYQEAVGSLLYLAQATRPDIAFAVNDVSRFNHKHSTIHWAAVKRIFRYLQGTLTYKLRYTAGDSSKMLCYTDSDWASDTDSRRSCAGHGATSWSSKRQTTVALSSTEAEYMALSSAASDVLWMQQLVAELDSHGKRKITILCDNTSAISMAENDAFRPRTKHIDIKHHFIREKIDSGVIDIKYIPTDKNVADSLTKPVTKHKHIFCAMKMGLMTC